ncbi:hypothetical protein JCM10908_001173 [Rhodotorula pacifica]|uniref:uncharacterized protein n=1 Tax=Rhodotorula pacifica TaxID=1495444 RepID=UPI003181D7B0
MSEKPATSPEHIAGLPEPAVGVEYPSALAAKIAILQNFLRRETEPWLKSNSHASSSVCCRLTTTTTVSHIGSSSRCAYMYKYEPIERGKPHVRITLANLIHTCPEHVRKERYRSLDPNVGSLYTELKLYSFEIQYKAQQGQPSEAKPALTEGSETMANPISTAADYGACVGQPGNDVSVTATDVRANTHTLGEAQEGGATTALEQPTPPANPPPAPVVQSAPAATALEPSAPASSQQNTFAAASTEPNGACRASPTEEPPPYSAQISNGEPARKRARLGVSSSSTEASPVGTRGPSLGCTMASTSTSCAGASFGQALGYDEKNSSRDPLSFAASDSRYRRDSQASTSTLYDSKAPPQPGSSKSFRDAGSFCATSQPRYAAPLPPSVQPLGPPPPPPLVSLLAAFGFNSAQRVAVQQALRTIGFRSIRDLTSFVLLEDDTVNALAVHLGSFNVPWDGDAIFPSLELAVGSLLAQIRLETREVRRA